MGMQQIEQSSAVPFAVTLAVPFAHHSLSSTCFFSLTIRSQGEGGAQFILTAHKKQMIEGADRIFRAEMVNNLSRIHQSDVAEARKYFAKKPRDEDGEEAGTSSDASEGSASAKASGSMVPPIRSTPIKRPMMLSSPRPSSPAPSSESQASDHSQL